MKIWLKLIIGLILGILIASLLPTIDLDNDEKDDITVFLTNASDFFIHIGRYAVFPLVFFSLTIAIYELKLDKHVFRVFRKTFLYILAITGILVLLGFLSSIIFSPRISIITAITPPEPEHLNLTDSIFSLFPKNAFNVFFSGGNLILPLCILAIILGSNLTFDRVLTRPIVQMCDSLSRVFYHINSLIIELFWIAIIVISAASIRQMIMLKGYFDIYINLLLIIILNLIIIILGIYPLIVYLFDRTNNPYKLLYSSIACGIAGLITGDEFISYSFLTKHGYSNFAIPRKVGTVVYTTYAIFGRAGTAMVTCISFFLLLNTLLPSVNIDFLKILYAIGFSFIFSFILGSYPGIGTYIALTFMVEKFNEFWPTSSLSNHYIILEPIKFILISLSVFIDATTSYIISYIIGKQEKCIKLNNLKDFI